MYLIKLPAAGSRSQGGLDGFRGRVLSHRAFQSHLGCKLNVRRRARVRRGGPKRAPRTRNHEKA